MRKTKSFVRRHRPSNNKIWKPCVETRRNSLFFFFVCDNVDSVVTTTNGVVRSEGVMMVEIQAPLD